jgi:prolyl oligopeptidase
LLNRPVAKAGLVTIVVKAGPDRALGLGQAAVRDFASHLRDGDLARRGDARQIIAYGISQSGSDWIQYKVMELATKRTLADTVEWAKVSNVAWNGDGFYYSRYPEPPEGHEKASINENHQVFFHKLGTPQSADVKIYARPDQPTWFVFGGLDESGKYLFINTSKGTDKNELYIADLGDPMRPNISAPIRPVVTHAHPEVADHRERQL